jgi:hypothetical protein
VLVLVTCFRVDVDFGAAGYELVCLNERREQLVALAAAWIAVRELLDD